MADAANVRQGSALGFLGVAEQRAGGAQAQAQVVAAKADQILGAKLLGQALEGAVLVKLPGRAAAHGAAALNWSVALPVVGNQQLGWCQTLQLAQQGLPAAQLHNHKAAAVDVQRGQAKAFLGADQCRQQVVATLVQQGLVADGARGNDAGDLTLDRPFAGGRVAHLFANDDRFAELHQSCEVTLG